MAADFRNSGVGFPNGAVSNSAVFALPSPDLLMLATEGRYHHDAAVRAGKRCLWRAVPRVGKRPAELGWSPAKFVTEALNLTDEPTQPITDFVFANELDLNSERGDGADDWSGLDKRYALIGGWGLSVVQGLRAALPGTLIHWPAWTPDHDALGHLDAWRAATEACQGVDFHAYDNLDNIERQYIAYRQAFPDKPLALTEWHCKGDVEEERRVLTWLAETMAADPLFDAAYFFIWRWWNHPGWWDDDWDIEHSPARLALFRDPPVVAQPEPAPVPVPIPVPEPATMISGIDVSNNNGTIDWDAVVNAGVAWAYAKVSEGSGYRDRFFPANWAAMRDRGLARGGYHFARPSENDPEAEADWFLSLVDAAGGLDVGDFLVLDHEDERASGDTGWWALQWLRYVEQKVGFKPMIYTGKWIIDGQNLAAYPALAEYGLILAAYQGAAPPAPAPWPFLAGWQNDDHTGVPGVTGDHDWFFGTVEQLRKYGKPGTVTPPAPAPGSYSVGEGLLAAMTAHGDSPASNEVYTADQWSEALGQSGARYTWIPSLGRVVRYDPAA